MLPRKRIYYHLTAKGKREKQTLSLRLATWTATPLLHSHIEDRFRRAKDFKDLAQNTA
jgi:DNA-binding PadR family transcriptional regulator